MPSISWFIFCYHIFIYINCAEERIRTSMELPPLAPEASASTNFATSATNFIIDEAIKNTS